MKNPEHEKLREIQPKSQAIGEFFEWLGYEKGMFLCVYGEYATYPHSVTTKVEDLIAEFFEIDLKKIEEEKIAMLKECREAKKI